MAHPAAEGHMGQPWKGAGSTKTNLLLQSNSVTSIIFDILESSAYQKYSICWVLQEGFFALSCGMRNASACIMRMSAYAHHPHVSACSAPAWPTLISTPSSDTTHSLNNHSQGKFRFQFNLQNQPSKDLTVRNINLAHDLTSPQAVLDFRVPLIDVCIGGQFQGLQLHTWHVWSRKTEINLP